MRLRRFRVLAIATSLCGCGNPEALLSGVSSPDASPQIDGQVQPVPRTVDSTSAIDLSGTTRDSRTVEPDGGAGGDAVGAGSSGANGRPDDTFDCLGGLGPTVDIRGQSFGYTQYKNRGFQDKTIIDARGARWNHQQLPATKNKYPINIGGGANACFAGGIVIGTSDLNASWSQLYAGTSGRLGGANSASLVAVAAAKITIDGLRVHNTWDAVRPGSNTAHFTIKNVWASRTRDDCVENDNMNPGLVEDSLFDGCYVAISVRASKSNKDGTSNTLTVRDSLFRLQPLPGAHNEGAKLQPGHKGWIKSDPDAPKLRLHGNIFMAEQKSNMPDRGAGIPALKRDGTPAYTIDTCSNNIMVWLGPGPYPYHLDRRCFTVTTDRSVWDKARQRWIDCHPKLGRLPSDPPSDPARCK